jgi:hypothetical protein
LGERVGLEGRERPVQPTGVGIGERAGEKFCEKVGGHFSQ